MKRISGLVAALAMAGLSCSAFAQAPPPGSYQRSCSEIRMHGATLTATCRRQDGRSAQSSLDVAQCRADIENRNGRLKCASGVVVAPLPGARPPAYAGPGYPAPGYPSSGYPPPPHAQGGGYREYCEALRHKAHELYQRLERTPYGQHRDYLEHRLSEINYQRQECRHY